MATLWVRRPPMPDLRTALAAVIYVKLNPGRAFDDATPVGKRAAYDIADAVIDLLTSMGRLK